MEYFGSLIAILIIPYLIGFAMMGFWWRWWLLLPAGLAGLVLLAYLFSGEMDGPGAALGFGLGYMFGLGMACGAIASAAVIVGRGAGWRLLRPVIALPAAFALGFGGQVALLAMDGMQRDAYMAAPAAECFDRLYPARIGSVELALPTAPDLSVMEKNNISMLGLGHNPDIRTFCTTRAGQVLGLTSLSLLLDGGSYRPKEAETAFCASPRPEYPWADLACRPRKMTERIFDRPLTMTVKPLDKSTDPALARKRLLDSPMTTTEDGLKVYRGEQGVMIERSDGYFATCGIQREAKPDEYLDCTASEILPGDLVISYTFNIGRARFAQATPEVAAAARQYFQSLVKK